MRGALVTEKCWICGEVDNLTGEHRTKKSDLKAEIPRTPFYLHTETQRNIKVQGYNSKALQSISICARCNNERTQPFDQAWSTLSDYLRSKPRLKGGERVNLKKIFPGAIHTSMLNVHLYFVKLFGCNIRENNIPIDLKSFSFSILNNQPHENIHIAICPKSSGHLGQSDLRTTQDNWKKEVVFAVWHYELHQFSIRIIFAAQGQKREGLKNTWHPSTVNKYIKVSKL